VSARWLAAAALAMLLAGCGDPDLWARYQAERGFWKARRLVQRIQLNPSLAKPMDYQEAIESFADVERRFPLAQWATPERLRRHRARDVAATSGDAMIAIGRLEEARERFDRAGEIYRETAAQLGGFPTMRLKALLAEAALADRTDDSTRAFQGYVDIARTAPVLDPDLGQPVEAAVEAPLRVARELRNGGANAVADSVLRAAEERQLAEAPKHHRTVTAWTLWLHVGELRAARPGALEGALDAGRRALAEALSRPTRARLISALAEFCIQGGQLDSALAYTAWLGQGFGNEARARSMMLTAQVWEKVDVDSAIVAYGRYIDRYRNSPDQSVMAARFRRAELLEDQGRWLESRAEFRGLATSSATDEYALRSYERIVMHHLRAGEKEMARIEASRTLEAMDHLLTTVQDDATLLRIRQLRAQVLLDVGSWDKACAALQDLWTHYRHMTLGVEAGFRAAELAEHQLNDKDRARRLYEEIASDSSSPVDQAMARRQLERMRS